MIGHCISKEFSKVQSVTLWMQRWICMIWRYILNAERVEENDSQISVSLWWKPFRKGREISSRNRVAISHGQRICVADPHVFAPVLMRGTQRTKSAASRCMQTRKYVRKSISYLDASARSNISPLRQLPRWCSRPALVPGYLLSEEGASVNRVTA